MLAPMTVTLRQLRAFTEAYRLRNLTHAAEAVHVTQSAMSVLIRQLEESLGVQLFERTPRSLRPKAAADDAYTMASEILDRVAQLQGAMRKHAAGASAQLAFTCIPSLASTVVAPVVAAFKLEMPDVRVVMHDAADASLIDEVLSERVEFSIGFFETEPEALVLSPLVVDCLNVVYRRDSPLASLERITWADLAGQPVIRLSKGAPLQRQIGEALSIAGTANPPDYEVSFLHTALAMIAQGLGIAILPGYLVRGYLQPGSLVARKLEDPVVERSLLVHMRHGHALSEPAQRFLDILRERLAA
jgi:DNA-binding transcriptional LysR family regulator